MEATEEETDLRISLENHLETLPFKANALKDRLIPEKANEKIIKK